MIMKKCFAAALICMFAAETLIAQDQSRRGGRRNTRDDRGLKVGQLAPTFELTSLDGKQTYDLKSLRGDKPVMLFFGSYT